MSTTAVALRALDRRYIQMLGVLGIFKAKGTKIFNDVVGKSSEVAGGSLTSAVAIKCLLASQAYTPFVLNMILPLLSAVLIGIIMVPTTMVKRCMEASKRAREVTMRERRQRAAARQTPALEHQPSDGAAQEPHYIFLPPHHEPVIDVGSLCGGVPTKVAMKLTFCRKPASKECVALIQPTTGLISPHRDKHCARKTLHHVAPINSQFHSLRTQVRCECTAHV